MEYLAAAIVDLDLHALESAKGLDVDRFEAETLHRIGMPRGDRHAPPHPALPAHHGGYAAGYYSYLWSEVMDADAFHAFEEAGDIFDPKLARRLYDNIYSAGGKPRRGRRPISPSAAGCRRRKRCWRGGGSHRLI